MTSVVQQGTVDETQQVPPEIKAAPKLISPSSIETDLAALPLEQLGEHHADFVSFHQSYVNQYISLADTKAVWTFAITSALIAYLFTHQQIQAVLLHPQWSAAFVLAGSSVALLLISSLCSFLVIAPRLATSGEGLVFFRSVASRKNAETYAQAVAKATHAELTFSRLKHTYDLSKVCTRKYDYLLKAMWLGLPGLWGAVLLLLLWP